MVKRLQDWPMKLATYLKERQNMPFQWGMNDCVSFACQAVDRMTGDNIFDQYKGYETKESAQDIMDSNGGMIKLLSKHYGKSHSKYRMAKRGDVVLVKVPDLTAGIVDDTGTKIAVILREGGLARLPLNRAVYVWSI